MGSRVSGALFQFVTAQTTPTHLPLTHLHLDKLIDFSRTLRQHELYRNTHRFRIIHWTSFCYSCMHGATSLSSKSTSALSNFTSSVHRVSTEITCLCCVIHDRHFLTWERNYFSGSVLSLIKIPTVSENFVYIGFHLMSAQIFSFLSSILLLCFFIALK